MFSGVLYMKDSKSSQKAADQKKAYQQPELALYGSLTRLTEAQGQGPAADHGSNMMSPVTPS